LSWRLCLVLWGNKSHVEQYFNPWEAWPQYATNVVRYIVVPAEHYQQEQAPDEVCAALDRFFRA
jgi:pimeloyl-ACP methyl ester carboxylesterase